jgi:hypothetical protein
VTRMEYFGGGGGTYGNRPLGIPRRSWEDNNKMVLKWIGRMA